MLLHDNVPPTDIMQLTGHTNVNSINNYATPRIEQQREMSHVLTTKIIPINHSSVNDENNPLINQDISSVCWGGISSIE